MTEQLTRLGNGLTVATIAMPELETAAVSLVIDAGGRNETKVQNGLAHFFEHMVFKGTRKHSARAIAETVENVGGSLNAWTSRDATCFHARVLAEHVPLATEVIAGLVTEPVFASPDISLEKQVVLSEIGESLEAPDEQVFDHLQAVAFPDQSLGRPILGTPDSLDTFDAAALTDWRDRHYRGDGLILAAAGKISHDELVGQAEELFSALPSGRSDGVVAAQWAGGERTEERPSEQLHIALAFQGFAPRHEQQMAARLFASALGGGMSSRLFQQLREDRGLAYSIGASHSAHADIGMLSIYAATRPEDGHVVLAEARAIAEATSRDLEMDELLRAKAQLKAGMLMALESSVAKADWMAGSLLTWGRVLSKAELVAQVDALTLDEVRAAGAAMLSTAPALAAVGPQVKSLRS